MATHSHRAGRKNNPYEKSDPLARQRFELRMSQKESFRAKELLLHISRANILKNTYFRIDKDENGDEIFVRGDKKGIMSTERYSRSRSCYADRNHNVSRNAANATPLMRSSKTDLLKAMRDIVFVQGVSNYDAIAKKLNVLGFRAANGAQLTGRSAKNILSSIADNYKKTQAL